MNGNFTLNKKVVIAMSGGVDSSVAAALLKEQGYDLIGVTMLIFCTTNSSDRSCCSIGAANDAKKMAEALGFPHYTLNFKDEFKKMVIDNFIEEYKDGRTPNPCIRCNQFIKFNYLLQKAKELGADLVATGHYARIVAGCKLLKGLDKRKDQSYVLYRMNQEMLSRVLFPLGEMTKEQVREKAREMKLSVAEKKESQDICFVEDDDYGKFLREAVPEAVKSGPILDKTGKVVGQHEGIAFYTIGQRKGIGHHKGNPKYVVEIDRLRNAVVIGDDADTLKEELTVDNVSFVAGELPAKPLEITAKIRYNSPEAEAVMYPLEDGKIKIKFNKAQRAVTPGQSVVFYKGDEVLGGGIII